MKAINFLYKRGDYILLSLGVIVILLGIFIWKNIMLIFLGLFPILLVFEVFPNKDIIVAKNSNNSSAINYLQKLIRTAKNEILIFSYSLNPKIYNDFGIIESLETARRNGVVIKSIVSSNGLLKKYSDSSKNQELPRLIRDKVIHVYYIDEKLNPDFFFES